MSLVPVINSHARRESHPGTVLEVRPDSVAERARIARGDVLLSINGHTLRDPIDLRFYGSDERLVLRVRREHAERTIRVRKAPDQELGVVIPELTLEDIAECNNHCPFCFVTQLPRGMRSTLQIKDDDYRFSFLNASFVTLTNLSEDDWRRIEEQRLSPLYISVHSTDPDDARQAAGQSASTRYPRADRPPQPACVVVHTQLVVCPGINDGEDLHASIEGLLARYPMVRTIAAVPVGLTKIRTERTASAKNPLRRFRADEAARVIREVLPYQRQNTAAHGEPIVYLSDEFYLLAGRRVPARRHYTDQSQLENGVGLVRELLDSWRALKRRLPRALPTSRHLSMACGTLIYPVLAQIVAEMNEIANLRVDLFAIENRLFGTEVTVSGPDRGRGSDRAAER